MALANILLPFASEGLAPRIWYLLLGCLIVPPTALLLTAIYNIYLSPLRRFPGPKLSAATPIPFLKALITGESKNYIVRLHQQYGDVVRISPQELSYTSAQAWKDIYTHRPGHQLFEKEVAFYVHPPNGIPSIFSADHKHHARTRRLMSHAFSEKALQNQEPLMRVYLDLLINGLREKADKGEFVDMVAWFNWTTFDIMGDLSFGEPFDCLKTSTTHPWVDIIFKTVQSLALMGAIRRTPGAQKIVKLFVPKGQKERWADHARMTDEKVARRLDTTTERPDFMDSLLKNQNDKDKALSLPELSSAFFATIVGGSETTATLLSGCLYLLLKNPDKLRKLEDEVRQAFTSDTEIQPLSTNKLKYTLAVLEESMRVYPPVPIGMPRTVPKGGNTILGEWVPGGTSVSVHQYASFHSSRHWRDPESFIPERFLGDPGYADDDRKILQPFSMGPRNCIGRNLAYAEMRPILARIVYNFDMELAEESSDWMSGQPTFILWHKQALKIKFTPVQRAA